MKQKDIAMLAIIVVVGAIASIIVSNMLFGTAKTRQKDVEVVPPISSTFQVQTHPDYFTGGYDPTQLIQVAPNDNTNPFN
jgi:hypothetical protein